MYAGDLEMIDALRELEEEQLMAELLEENAGEDAAFGDMDKVNKSAVNARAKEIKQDPEAAEELAILREWLDLSNQEAATKKALKTAEAELDNLAYIRYESLTKKEVVELVVECKWLDFPLKRH